MNILEKIVAEKRKWLAEAKRSRPEASFASALAPNDRDFYAVLEKRKHEGVPAFIMECKKASPSQGLIRADFSPGEIAKVYSRYADVVSVLCDEAFFQGRFENIPLVREHFQGPVLCKDFIIDPYQVRLARYFGANAILLMLSVLNDEEYRQLSELAHSLGMGILTEADTPEDIARANAFGARVIGINNRNLRTLQTNLSRTQELAELVRDDAVKVAESGLHTHLDACEMSRFASAFLVGTSLMREENLDRACRALVFGENKVCGITRVEDALAARDAGALFGGLIFAEKSPRKLSVEAAKKIVTGTPNLDFVGVFQNNPLEEIVEAVNELKLFAIQLHGNEDENLARELKEKIPTGTQIWRVFSASNLSFPQTWEAQGLYARVLLDSGNGGTGTCFNWETIPEKWRPFTMLAGGLSPENARSAHANRCLGLDFNSGLEIAAGIKSEAKINAAFKAIRHY